jgi:hypothetical protein
MTKEERWKDRSIARDRPPNRTADPRMRLLPRHRDCEPFIRRDQMVVIVLLHGPDPR